MEQAKGWDEASETSSSLQEKVMGHIKNYCMPSWIDSIYHFLMTILAFLFCLQFSTLWMVPILALVFVRIFIVFHDLAHGSFFPNKQLNWLGALVTGTLVFTPATYWDRGHNYHHKNSNKLNHPQHAQTAAWEKNKYDSVSDYMKTLYRWTYGKYTLFTINPLIYFLFVHRFFSTLVETATMVCYLGFLYHYLNVDQYVYFGLSIWLAGVFGFILFHAQHTFDNVYRAYDLKDYEKLVSEQEDSEQIKKIRQWSYFMNGMYGSSFLQVPFLLKPFTCNIEYHHIHHLNSKVPFYKLQQCHEEGCELFKDVPRVSLWKVLTTLHYSLYDTETNSFVDVYDEKSRA
jgi:acyl-lipid omega-6 desaturase (Delta-12 desaturase)